MVQRIKHFGNTCCTVRNVQEGTRTSRYVSVQRKRGECGKSSLSCDALTNLRPIRTLSCDVRRMMYVPYVPYGKELELRDAYCTERTHGYLPYVSYPSGKKKKGGGGGGGGGGEGMPPSVYSRLSVRDAMYLIQLLLLCLF